MTFGPPLGQALGCFRHYGIRESIATNGALAGQGRLASFGQAEADLALLLAKNAEAWEKYGQFYEGWTHEEVAELLEAVRAAS